MMVALLCGGRLAETNSIAAQLETTAPMDEDGQKINLSTSEA